MRIINWTMLEELMTVTVQWVSKSFWKVQSVGLNMRQNDKGKKEPWTWSLTRTKLPSGSSAFKSRYATPPFPKLALKHVL